MTEADQRELERLCGLRADRHLGRRRLHPTHFILLARIAVLLRRARRIRFRLFPGTEVSLILPWVDRATLGMRSVIHDAVSVLQIDARADPLADARFATLRRHDRKAERAGIICREVPPAEREALLAQAVRFEVDHPDLRYRREKPKTDGLLAAGLWLVAESGDGTPLVLSVTPMSGNTALLRYMRTMSDHPDTRLARYALTAALVRELRRRHVSYLVDNVSPISLPSALRQFATMTGFRIMRATIAKAPR